MIYTVTLNPALDYVMRLPQLRQGEVNRAHSEEIQLGGKGINVSRVLSELGEASTALGFIAGFTGDALQQGLRAMGLHTDFVRLKRGATRINVKLKAQGETDINATGPAVDETALAALLQKLDALGPGDMLVLAGSVPAAVPADIYKQILARLRPRGVPAVVDAEKELLAGALAYRPFLVKPNHLELGEMFGQRLQSEAEIRSCAARLQARGAQNVLVSMAGEGALLLDEHGHFHRAHAPPRHGAKFCGRGRCHGGRFSGGLAKDGQLCPRAGMGHCRRQRHGVFLRACHQGADLCAFKRNLQKGAAMILEAGALRLLPADTALAPRTAAYYARNRAFLRPFEPERPQAFFYGGGPAGYSVAGSAGCTGPTRIPLLHRAKVCACACGGKHWAERCGVGRILLRFSGLQAGRRLHGQRLYDGGCAPGGGICVYTAWTAPH